MNKNIFIVIGIIIVLLAAYFLLGSRNADDTLPTPLESPIGENREAPDTLADINKALEDAEIENLDDAFQGIDADIKSL